MENITLTLIFPRDLFFLTLIASISISSSSLRRYLLGVCHQSTDVDFGDQSAFDPDGDAADAAM